MSRPKKAQFQSIADSLLKYNLQDKGGFITQEFQDFGYRLACEMGEESKKALYIKLAKNTDRIILERARTFVLDAKNVNHRGRLYLWAVNKLKKGEPLSR